MDPNPTYQVIPDPRPTFQIIDPGFDPSILRHSGIWGAADKAVLTYQKNPPLKKNKLLASPLSTTALWVRIHTSLKKS